ncbi:CidA/LrgA family protein [Virgibacillus halophilus]
MVRIAVHILLLYGFYQVGNGIQQLFHLFIPGSVIGMVLLFILLATGVLNVRLLEEGLQFMVAHLSLFFIPATIGIMNYLDLFQGKGILLILIVLVSTVMVMATSGLVSQWLVMRKNKRNAHVQTAGELGGRGEERA